VIGYLVVIAAVLLTFGRLADMLDASRSSWPVSLFLRSARRSAGRAFTGHAHRRALLPRAGCGCHPLRQCRHDHAPVHAAERGRALGLNMILLALGVSAGPTIGGILTQTLGWRWIFYVNLPIGGLAFQPPGVC
jgi:hypothetical protein